MQAFFPAELIETAKELGRLSEVYTRVSNDRKTLADETMMHNKKYFEDRLETFKSLDLNMCAISAERIALNIAQPVKDLSQMLDDLSDRMMDECSLRKFIALSVQDAAYVFPKTPLFGDDVEQKYPSAAFEIDEASKCLGLSRPTATVFHLIRVMEIGIRTVARCLGIPDPTRPAERNWGNILKAIKDDLDAHTGSSPLKAWANPKERQFFLRPLTHRWMQFVLPGETQLCTSRINTPPMRLSIFILRCVAS